MSKSSAVVRPQDYADSPAHYAVATGDHAALINLISPLPKLSDPSRIHTESDSLAEDRLADRISAALDRRDNRLRETPLHLAVRLNDVAAAHALAAAGADISLQNAAGWNPLQEALLRRCPAIVPVLVQRHHLTAWSKWRRRLPRLVAALRRMRDFYMEISFHFDSSVVPFVGKIAPSDTYKIWKRDGNLRADTSLAGYDGLKIQRVNQSFLFLNDDVSAPQGSLITLNHDKKLISNVFENAGNPLSDAEISNFCNQTSVYRPGIDVTRAELIGRTNWRRQEKTESVGEWKARVYEMHNVHLTFRSRKIAAAAAENRGDPLPQTCILPLEIDEASDDGFIVAENPRFSVSGDYQRRHSSFVGDDREFVSVSRKSVDIFPGVSRRRACTADRLVAPPRTKEKEFAKSLRPTVWLTEQFPLKTEEVLPLLDILSNKIKTVRRMRELLTTTLPPSTFPVKVAIPVIPTVRVVITFTKFMELQPIEHFYTPLSSPTQLLDETTCGGGESSVHLPPRPSKGGSGEQAAEDPFVIPSGYRWSSSEDKNRKMKKSKSTATR
ncbi:hypothetical protein SASPL_152079 [Salvia splendens]|uniref:Ankyrin repeat domain-containing protein n=1 Tax=Salvia splendens TaxID=180675 RepID=A0A8X8W2F3_SALSN|nr:ankyrin repeat domain-containing protein 13C-A-like [Salvia splendens]KAG6386902.1 hypothetical protein SASPL_152079 [Salvia splendens]